MCFLSLFFLRLLKKYSIVALKKTIRKIARHIFAAPPPTTFGVGIKLATRHARRSERINTQNFDVLMAMSGNNLKHEPLFVYRN